MTKLSLTKTMFHAQVMEMHSVCHPTKQSMPLGCKECRWSRQLLSVPLGSSSAFDWWQLSTEVAPSQWGSTGCVHGAPGTDRLCNGVTLELAKTQQICHMIEGFPCPILPLLFLPFSGTSSINLLHSYFVLPSASRKTQMTDVDYHYPPRESFLF